MARLHQPFQQAQRRQPADPLFRRAVFTVLIVIINIQIIVPSSFVPSALAYAETTGQLPRNNGHRFLSTAVDIPLSFRPIYSESSSSSSSLATSDDGEGRRLAAGAAAVRQGDSTASRRRLLQTTCVKVAGYVALSDVDHIGDTITTSAKPAVQCSKDTQCIAYINGQLKSNFTPMTSSPGSCLYIKAAFAPTACPAFSGFTAIPDVDHVGDDLLQVTLSKAAAKCATLAQCKGFNSTGWLKSAVMPTTPASGSCLYVRNMPPSPPPTRSPPPPTRSPPPTTRSPPPTTRSPPPPTRSPPPPTRSSPPPTRSPPPLSSSPPVAPLSTAGCIDAAATLEEHNRDRAMHGSPALKWNEVLANSSKTWSQGLAAKGCNLQHSVPGGKYGENLYSIMSWAAISASNVICIDAVKLWYDEIKNYKFTKTPYTDNDFYSVGHFTQVVWKSTTQVGCGAALSADRKCYVVTCRYAPPGNYITDSQFYNNVPPVLQA